MGGMGIEDTFNGLVGKGKDLYEQNKEKIQEALKSEQAEDISDKVLDGASDLAKKVAPGSAAHIDGVRDNIDKSIGNE
jgi:phosphoglucomutase